ncbi:MAG TPA: hypothetical protein VGD99_27350 [Anaerolineae bacterium]|jgi:asparagine N-glycosylation enzyme membrane subunit Stt3
MIFVIITWLVRYGHVLGGGLWVGGYALLAMVIIPLLEKQRNNTIEQAAIKTVRLLTYAGTATMVFGLLLIARTRGYAALISGGEWGGIIFVCFIIAVALLGLNDSALRPAVKQLAETGDGRLARRFAWLGFILTIIAIGLMTRALYAGS